MVDLELMATVGSSNCRLKEIFTSTAPKAEEVLDDDKRKRRQCDYDLRVKFQDRINQRLMEHMNFSLKNSQFYGVVDLAWEPPPISKTLYPLILYAQGKLDLGQCADQLAALKCADQFVTKNDKGHVTEVDLPRFTDMAVHLVRSVVTRRLAAQNNKYSNLFPYFKYESRSTSQLAKLRADLFSQRTDIMADQFDYRDHDENVYRDMMMYAHSIDFIRASWEREIHWRRKPKTEGDESTDLKPEAYTQREGLAWINPHPTRVFWDIAYPLASLNSDSGCEFVGFWDVIRYGEVEHNPAYWNRVGIGYTQNYVELFSNFSQYWSQYQCTISPPKPTEGNWADLTSSNDRKNMVGVYSGAERDMSMIVANYYEKIIPKEWGIGDYPYPVWVRFVQAGWDTVIFAEFLPSSPCAVARHNIKADRRLNLGIGHQLLAYQDQMTNLVSYLLLALKADNFKVLVVDIDPMSAGDGLQLKEFRKQAKGKNYYSETHVLEVSRSKLQELGLKVDDIIKLVETKSSTQINLIFQAMLNLMQLVERLEAMSPQEQGQPAPREISATETNLIAGTTESVYNFISDSIDSYRAAKKRIIYDSYINFGEKEFQLPVINRYPVEVIQKAGLKPMTDNEELAPNDAFRGTIIGSKTFLVHDYIFTSRDGAERTSNVQAAQNMTEVLKTVLPIPAVQEAMTVGDLFGALNEYARLAGAFDFKLDAGERADQPLSPAAGDELQVALEKILERLEAHDAQFQQLQGMSAAQPPMPNGNGRAQPATPAVR